MRRIARVILALYPVSWRDRYGPELDEIVASTRVGIAQLVDLLRGAIDARRHPRLAVPAGAVSVALARPAPPPATPAPRSAYGVIAPPGLRVLSRRRFMRRMLGAGVGLLSLEFVGGTVAFLWPKPAGALGVEHAVGTVAEISRMAPEWSRGRPWEFRRANAFLVNVPAAMARASGAEIEVPDPGADGILALWRKCPHLGCMIPNACEGRSRFQCYCHQSTYNIIGEKLHLGPAPRGMDRFPVRVDGAGVVHVDTREVISGPPRGANTFHDPWPEKEGCA